ncbi:hypothetical protein T440DRAFT_507281 [Plenodomus tracheiphilus IPT5]|uniref:Uncharacterized protein n=1 Tax=Plenodomus tracheiphilus IPT5 TaxID=1408161 RepID=A0A6A7B7U5_9PLEO|nr:hypothetical protein T440DRAFT_507281 [Plenodomus tracheiphilus IPT5]
MATGFDALIDSVLSEIALCGVQGAGSTDFYRFIQKFYERLETDGSSSGLSSASPGLPANGLGRKFHEQVWKWVCGHSDMRIIYQNEVRHYTLSEFEAAELHETGTSGGTSMSISTQLSHTLGSESTQPSETLSSMGGALRARLLNEGTGLKGNAIAAPSTSHRVPLRQLPRQSLGGGHDTEPVFDDPEATVTAPRLYASQGRIWQALTGHGIDLKKVPSMEFVLLSLITARGSEGIAQPDLIRASGQDKRSVPHRTDELARKGYIVKIPVQAGKVRTSLCVHNKFASQSHFIGSSAQEDVYREDSFVLSGFVHLLYNTFKDAGVVPTRELRNRLGVPMKTWNKRATQGALIRLDQTGMIKRLSVRKKKSEDSWLTCIRILRKPRDEDVMNLGFRRQGLGDANAADEVLDDDAGGHTLMRDLEVDTLEDDDVDEGNQAHKPPSFIESDRIPPQWTPDRFLANFSFDAVALGGSDGWDSNQLRARMMGPFWRRPLESYFTRLTDDWEKTQPLHLRHLAIIRDSRNTSEKKYLHYVYRTHGNFQKAVDAGAVHWAGVSHLSTMGPLKVTSTQTGQSDNAMPVDAWGFEIINPKDLEGGNGSATLSEARKAIVHRRAYGPRWDSAISHQIGHRKINEVPRSSPKYPRGPQKKKRETDGKPTLKSIKLLKESQSAPIISLSPEQRVSLGLKPHGRLSKHAEKQITEHRRKTGNPTSLPDKIEDGPSLGGQPPLMTAEERIAAGLPPRGRLGIKQENAIRVQRGLAKITSKTKKRAQNVKSEPTVLSKQQRIDLKWIDHGRLPQDLIDGLRQERRDGIALKDSKVIALYDEVMKAAKVTKDKKEAARAGRPYIPETIEPSEKPDEQGAPAEDQAAASVQIPDSESMGSSKSLEKDIAMPSSAAALTSTTRPVADKTTTSADDTNEITAPTPVAEAATSRLPGVKTTTTPIAKATPAKRKARNTGTTSKTPKKPRTESVLRQNTSPERPTPTPAPTAPNRIVLAQQTGEEQSGTMMLDAPMTDAIKDVSHALEESAASEQVQSSPSAHELEVLEVTPSSAPITKPPQEQPQSSVLIHPSIEVQEPEPTPSPSSTSGIVLGAKKALTSLSLIPPGLNKLKIREKAKYKWYTERSSPGVYLDSFSRHKAPRGRPRKAFIATFRLPGLSSLEWFRSEQSSSQPARADAESEDTVKANSIKSGDMRVETIPENPQCPDASHSLSDAGSVPLPNVTLFPEKEAQSTVRTPGTDRKPGGQGGVVADVSGSQIEALLPESNQTSEVGSVPAHLNAYAPVGVVNIQPSTIEAGQRPENTLALPPPRTVAGWTVVNGNTPSDPSKYESPYGPSKHTNVEAQPQESGIIRSSNTAMVTTTPVVAGNNTNSNDVPSPFSNTSFLRRTSSTPSKPRPRPSRKKSKKPQTIGSALFFRRQIIWDIIDMCNGVFPDQGEIGRPFSKLWDERHGHVQGLEKPIASTVTETMRNMCTNPAFGIKRMVFQVRMNYKKGPYLTKKAIIARTHLDATSPQVLKLAHAITNYSHDRSHQYFPEEIRHLIDDTSLYLPVPRAPKDESVVLNQNAGELEEQIKEAKKLRRKRIAEQRKLATAARKAQNARVEEVATRKEPHLTIGPPEKRTRLASLNDKNKRYRRATLSKVAGVTNEESESTDSEKFATRTKANQIPALVWTKPIVGPTATHIPAVIDVDPSTSDDEDSEEESSEQAIRATREDMVNSELPTIPGKVSDKLVEQVSPTAAPPKSRKRVRIADPKSPLPIKRPRKNMVMEDSTQDAQYIDSASAESDASSSSEIEEDSGDYKQARTNSKPKKRIDKAKPKRGKLGPPPTLLERLTGLTGDPNDPIYLPPYRQRTRVGRPRPWNERRKRQRNRKGPARKSSETPDALDRFKKLCCTLIVAISMSGEEGLVDWGIVEKVYSSDKLFDAPKTKKLWAWMQSEMAPQVEKLTEVFQTLFLEAYEQGQVSPIEDPGTYDWASLVRWATRSCTYPELPLPLLREALKNFAVDESEYAILDRKKWYRDKIADRSRTLLQLQHSFVSPLHRARDTIWSSEDKFLKARSWVRANTATPQSAYDGKQAHDKLMVLGESALTSVVGDLVEKRNLRMRKLKRLLPGRNYSFTRVLARKYMRQFELGDFMSAIKVKKDMDVAFADDDPSKRFYSISRLEEDGSIAAITSMVSEGGVKLVPQLPPVNNAFGAPLPRLSIWGFCEGDYIHRAIDRERLFWDIYVVPTAKYRFGNPLQSSLESLASTDADGGVDWPSLPAPPLPGKHDPNALLPIWSSIDGQSVTWPWWYRILNIVLQPLIFQPGATSSDIYSHCTVHTTEIFEIELVLSWLESVNAVSKTVGGGYIAQPGWWAAFGDRLKDVDDDWFGEHIKRKSKHQEKQQWREQYNLRHSTLQTRGTQEAAAEAATPQLDNAQTQAEGGAQTDMAQQILENPKKQYSITQDALETSEPLVEKDGSASAATATPSAAPEHSGKSPAAGSPAASVQQSTTPVDAPADDVEMVDIYAEAENDGDDAHGEDVDAEGEIDDAMYE